MVAHAASRISEYSLIGNCRTAALISQSGSVDWCCFPRFDSPSYFARLLDPNGGHFSIMPAGPCESRQEYLDGTNVLQTRFSTGTGAALLTDLFSVKGGAAPDELWPDQEILRTIEGESGEMILLLELLPRGRYGRHGLRARRLGKWGICFEEGRKTFMLQTTLKHESLEVRETPFGNCARARFTVKAGERVVVSLTYADEAPSVMPPLSLAMDRAGKTVTYWKGWSARAQCEGALAPWIKRSALALKLLNFSPSGAFIAAPTTSLPENMGGTRNWDYRFCWLRDASFTTRALLRLGYLEEAKSFLNWLLHSTRLSWPKLKVLYSIYGEANIKEISADWLAGFNGSRPVRIGNHASAQTQLDVYGEVIDSFFALSSHLHPIDRETRKMVMGFGEAVSELWRQPDQGIWEYRSVPKHHTHSKLMCWVAMDRLAKLSARYGWRLKYDASKVAEEIRAEIELRGFDPAVRSYTRAFGDPALDASLLVMPLVGYCEPTAPRYLATRGAISSRLSRGDLIYRYLPASDGLSEPEGAFTLCNFWLSEACARAGEVDEARKWFMAVVNSLGTPGLASEQLDPDGRVFLGNYPQGFSHIGMINAALAIEAARKLKEGKAA
jgi:GH15 family glucan-1,4-alpha-glucosidase